jgi:hypothetical protein
MSTYPLFFSIEPRRDETRMMLSTSAGVSLKARLSPWPSETRALALILDGLVAWYGSPLCAVLDADAEDVQRNPGRWALLLGDLGPHIDVEWAAPVARTRSRVVDGLGDFRRAHRLLAGVRGPR